MISGTTSSATIPLVVDVRSPGEYARGHVAGSINLPLDSLPHGAAAVLPERDASLLLCCLFRRKIWCGGSMAEGTGLPTGDQRRQRQQRGFAAQPPHRAELMRASARTCLEMEVR
jgi:hypothetical protein